MQLRHSARLAKSTISTPPPPAGPSTSTSESITHEANVQAARTKLDDLQEDSIEFRLLNALMTHAPTNEGLNVIAMDILAASEHQDGLQELAEFYKTGLLLPMKAGGGTRRVSSHPSRGMEIQLEAEEIAVDLEAAKRDPSMLKKYTLKRDGYRCVVTHDWDLTSVSTIPSAKNEFDPGIHAADRTEAAHILPFSLMQVDTNKKLYTKATIWAVIKSFSGIDFQELSGDNINSLTNVITLTSGVHKCFGPLDLWFEAVPVLAGTYKIKKAKPYVLKRAFDDGIIVTLTTPSPEGLPLPDPRYLGFHAAIAKVVHMAGMAEHLDAIIRDYENIHVLSDEFSLKYFDRLLHMAQRCTVTS